MDAMMGHDMAYHAGKTSGNIGVALNSVEQHDILRTSKISHLILGVSLRGSKESAWLHILHSGVESVIHFIMMGLKSILGRAIVTYGK